LPEGFVEVVAHDSEALVVAMGEEGDRVAMRFKRGCRAFASIQAGAVVSYGWLSSGREWVGEVAIEIAPADREAYVWNCFTLEPFRRRGHYRKVLEGIVSVARAEGLSRLWIGSVDVPAEKADADAGFLRVLRFHVTHSRGNRGLRVSAAEGAEPRLVDEALKRLGMEGWTDERPFVTRRH
jgi:hypothetical protein